MEFAFFLKALSKGSKYATNMDWFSDFKNLRICFANVCLSEPIVVVFDFFQRHYLSKVSKFAQKDFYI